MAIQNPPIRGQAFTFEQPLVATAGLVFQTTPTLAAGDIQVSKDGAQFVNLATFPPAQILLSGGGGSGELTVVLTAAEMTADRVVVYFHDAAGAEWQDAHAEIFPVAATGMVVGSVTGAVGSVAGDVGGDVLGGVVGAVGSVAGDVGGDVVGDVLGGIVGDVGGDVLGGVVGAVGSVTGLTNATIATAIGTRIAEGAFTYDELLRIIAAVVAGKSSGGGTPIQVYRSIDDAANRATVTTTVLGNRTDSVLTP